MQLQTFHQEYDSKEFTIDESSSSSAIEKANVYLNEMTKKETEFKAKLIHFERDVNKAYEKLMNELKSK